MTTDELVSIMRFVLDEASREALETAEEGPKHIAKAVEEMAKSQEKAGKTGRETARTTGEFNKVFKTSNNILSKTDGVISSVTSGLKSFGLVSMVASGGMAAWGVNASNSARDLSNMSHSLQLSTQEIQAMSSVYESLGASMQDFVNDANSFQQMTGESFDLERMVELGERFRNMSEREALNEGRAFGLSSNTIRILRENGDQLERLTKEAYELGHVNTTDQLENLNNMNSSFSSLKRSISGASTAFQAGMSTSFVPMLDALSQKLAENQERFEDWGDSVAKIIEGVFSKQLPSPAGDDTSPEEREKHYNNARIQAVGRGIAINAVTAWDITSNLASAAWETGAGVLTLDPSRIGEGWSTAAGNIGESVVNAYDGYQEIFGRLNKIREDDLKLRYGDDYFERAEKLKRTMEERRRGPNAIRPADPYQSEAGNTIDRMMALPQFWNHVDEPLYAARAEEMMQSSPSPETMVMLGSRYQLPPAPSSVVNNTAGDTTTTSQHSNVTIYNENHFHGYEPEAIGPVITDTQRVARMTQPGNGR